MLPRCRERVGVRTRAAGLEALLGADKSLQSSQDPSHTLSAAGGLRLPEGRSSAGIGPDRAPLGWD